MDRPALCSQMKAHVRSDKAVAGSLLSPTLGFYQRQIEWPLIYTHRPLHRLLLSVAMTVTMRRSGQKRIFDVVNSEYISFVQRDGSF